MLRFKYQLYNGQQPHTAITDAVGSIDPSTDLFLGQWPSGAWIYGEIDTDSSNQSTLETALSNWSGTFLTDQQAKDYVDGVLPADTVVRTKLTADAASINETTDRLEKTFTES